MNTYAVSAKNEPVALFTNGVADCVVLALYNKDHGSYLAHLLRTNQFTDEQTSNACFPEESANIDCSGTQSKRGKTIQESLPAWFRSPETVCSLFSMSVDRLMIRANQIISTGFGGSMEQYTVSKIRNPDYPEDEGPEFYYPYYPRAVALFPDGAFGCTSYERLFFPQAQREIPADALADMSGRQRYLQEFPSLYDFKPMTAGRRRSRKSRKSRHKNMTLRRQRQKA